MKITRFFCLFWSVLAVAVCAGAVSAEALKWDPRVTTGTLQNGLRYAIYDSEKDSDPFNLRLIVQAGSVDEEAPSGLAHIVEHMVFRRTKAHQEGINAYITGLGWRQGLQVNALTRPSETQFMVRTRPNDALDLGQSLALLAQLAFHADLTAEDWDKERFIVLEELRRGDGVARRVNDLKKRVVRYGSRYADRPTIGTKAGIQGVTIADISAFYQRFYVPSNMVLVVSGAVDVAEAEEKINAHFGSQPKVPAPNRDYVTLPLQEGLVAGTVQDAQGTSSRVTYGLRFAMPSRAHPDGQYAYLQNYFIRRLMRDQFRARAPLYQDHLESLALTMQEITNERVVLAFSARTDQHEQAMKSLLAEIAYLRQTGLSEEGFEALRARAIDISKRNITAAKSRSFELWEDKITTALMQDTVLEDPAVRAARNIAWIEQMTLEELNARLATFLNTTDRFAYYQHAGDQVALMPDADWIEAEIAAVATEDLIAALPETPAPKIAENAPVPELPELQLKAAAGIRAEVRPDGQDIVEWALPNGDRVIWLQRPGDQDQLYMRAVAEPGFYNDAYPSWLSQAAIQLWSQSGFRFWDEETNTRWRAAQRKSWSWDMQDGQLSLAVAVAPDALGQMLGLYYRAIEQGQVTETASQSFAAQMAEQHRFQDRPAAKVAEAIRKISYPDLLSLPTEAQVSALNKGSLEAVAKQHLRQPVTWFIVGTAEETQVQTAFETYVAPLARRDTITPAFPQVAAHSTRETIAVYHDEKATIDLSFYVPMDWKPETAFVLSALTPLTQQALKAELRHRLGGIYTLQFELTLDPDQNHVKGELSFVTAPERAEDMLAAAIGVLENMPDEVDTIQIERLRQDIAYAEALRLENTNTWLRRLALSYKRYGDARYLDSMVEISNQLSKERLRELAETAFQFDNLKVVVAKQEFETDQ